MKPLGLGFAPPRDLHIGAIGKVLTFLGKMDEPMTGQKDKPTKYIIRILGPDKHVMEMHDLTLGEKSKVFEMTYTRKS